MKLIGLTGGVGMGKSTAASLLKRWQLPVVDTDDLARAVVEPGEPALDEVVRVFGPGVVTAEGRLDRAQVAKMVFADPQRRRELEAILHPRIRERWLAQAGTWRRDKRSLGVVVIPLLFETEAGPEFDAIICVACSRESQHKRLLDRGWTPAQIEQRVAAQWPIQRKMDLSHFVIWTEPAVEVQEAQLRRVVDSLG